jgi:hypothetical protein
MESSFVFLMDVFVKGFRKVGNSFFFLGSYEVYWFICHAHYLTINFAFLM